MKKQTTLFLEQDSLNHLDRLAGKMARRAGRNVSLSEVVEWLVRRHWKETMKARADKAGNKKLTKLRAVG